MTVNSIIRGIKSLCYKAITGRSFGAMGTGCRIYSPLKVNGKQGIYIGDNVVVEYKTWLAAVPLQRNTNARLEIGDGTILGHFNHIYATQSIKIGANVLTADRVYISDNLHRYQDITTPVSLQGVKQIAHVEIGDGSWLGEGVCVIGANIGKGCVIGANAVVTKNIPDHSVAVGIPAKVIKQYNHTTKQWERVD